ncbi:MAG: atpF [Rhodospirillales bacterium]|nr:atpF [Rhodospirillales bacterium]
MTIDWWTLGLQTVNVAVLIWLLGRFFWRPLAAMIEQRRSTAEKILAYAEAKRGEGVAALAEIAKTRAGFERERDAMLAAARKSAECARTERLAKAETEAAALQAAATAAIEKDKQAVDAAWAATASRLAVDIARRLAARLDGPAVRTTFLDWLLKEIQVLPAAARQAVGVKGVVLEAISAAALDPAEQDRYRDLIGVAFDAKPQISFKTDPDLIAGLELRGPTLVVSNSWRADLTHILADLAHDRR